uniref:Putative secreted protein n=1 Tax=Anopheles darlingi TaxID=43151 RepID=A0A2M4D139_ANODA
MHMFLHLRMLFIAMPCCYRCGSAEFTRHVHRTGALSPIAFGCHRIEYAPLAREAYAYLARRNCSHDSTPWEKRNVRTAFRRCRVLIFPL